MATILLVDDDEFVRTMLQLALSDKYDVIEAPNGKVGLEQFGSYHPDLVITDLNMPILSGLDMVEKIRSIDKKVKIIAHSSFDHPEKRDLMLKHGANYCLTKPTPLTVIENLIDDLLEE